MKANFQKCLSLVLVHEGGFVNHPADPGGATNKGVTLATYRAYVKKNGTVEDLKNITQAQVATVYKKHYWDAVRGDDLPSGVDYAVFDFAVNSGPGRAAKYLQAVVGVSHDGVIGPATLAAVRGADPSLVINLLCDRRMAFLQALSTWKTFGKGWSRRVLEVRSEAIKMVSVSPTPIPSTPDEAAGKAGGIGGIIGLIIAAILGLAAVFFGIGD